MADTTQFLNLYKWDKKDNKIDTINGITANMEKIDNKLKEHDETLSTIQNLGDIENISETLQSAVTAAEQANNAASAATQAASAASGLVQEVEEGLASAVKTVNGISPDENGNVEIEITIDGETVAFAKQEDLNALAGTGRTTETVKGNADALALHQADETNPHSVTKEQVGLGNVDNVKQASKADFDNHTGASKVGAHYAKNIALEDTANNFVSTEIEGAMAELFTSVSNGKGSIETAITGKGGTVSKGGAVATYAELVTGINSIPEGSGGVRKAKGTAVSSGGYVDVSGVAGFDFKPIVIILKKSGTSVELFGFAMYVYGDDGYEFAGFSEGSPFGMVNPNGDYLDGSVVSVGIGSFKVQVPSTGTYSWLVFGNS